MSVVLQPRHPQWTEPVTPFADHYDLVGSASYPLHDLRPVKRRYGARFPRMCALCGRTPPQVSFRKVAHACPAALGNRRLFSDEECDSCNERYSEWEHELVAMLAPQRILGGVAARQGRPKLSLHGRSSIEAVSPSEIKIVQDADDRSVALEVGDGKGTLTMRCPPYSPVKAIHALLRSLWLVLDADGRRRAPSLLNALQQPCFAHTQLFRFTSPGFAYPQVVLSGWLKKGAAFPGSTFVLQFVFFDTVLCWAWPDEAGNEAPTLLPPLPGAPPSITSGKYILRSVEDRVEGSSVTYHLSYERVERSDGDAPARPASTSLPTRPQRTPVVLETEGSSGVRLGIEADLYVDCSEPHRSLFRIQGGAWPGNIRIEVCDQGDGSVSIHLVPYSQPAAAVLAAAEFLKELSVSKRLNVKRKDGVEGFEVPLNALTTPTFDLSLLQDLALIAERLGADIRIPKRPTHEFLRDVRYVAQVLHSGCVECGAGTATFSVPAEAATKLVEGFAAERRPLIQIRWVDETTATLAGYSLPLGSSIHEFQGENVTSEPADDGMSRVTLRFLRKTDRYERWEPKEPIPPATRPG
jgi:hypothetical protein